MVLMVQGPPVDDHRRKEFVRPRCWRRRAIGDRPERIRVEEIIIKERIIIVFVLFYWERKARIGLGAVTEPLLIFFGSLYNDFIRNICRAFPRSKLCRGGNTVENLLENVGFSEGGGV